MTTVLKYNLKQITDISYSGFYFKIPEDTLDIINYLCTQVGTPCITSNEFIKSAPPASVINEMVNDLVCNKPNRKKRGNKGMEINGDDWESIRTFQTTKMETKTGIDGDISEIRLYLNKLTDKSFLDTREKIVEKIELVCANSTNSEDTAKIGLMLYEICSTNKFYSKIFADLFAELASKYDWLNNVFKEHYANIMDQYKNIQYVDSEKDYDGFCEMNKNNEKRRAITTFYFNLAINRFIEKDVLIKLLKDILTSIMSMISMPDKKNEVDELTEIVAILFNKDILDNLNVDEPDYYYVLDKSILDTVNVLAQQKVKDYPSLSNKAIFKYMDLVEM